MPTFIKVKDIKEGAEISNVSVMFVADHRMPHIVNCDWYKSGKWVELKDETNTSIAAEPIKREDYENVSNVSGDFVSVSMDSMKIVPKEKNIDVPDETKKEVYGIEHAEIDIPNNVPDFIKEQIDEDMKIKKMKPEEKPPVKKKRQTKKVNQNPLYARIKFRKH